MSGSHYYQRAWRLWKQLRLDKVPNSMGYIVGTTHHYYFQAVILTYDRYIGVLKFPKGLRFRKKMLELDSEQYLPIRPLIDRYL